MQNAALKMKFSETFVPTAKKDSNPLCFYLFPLYMGAYSFRLDLYLFLILVKLKCFISQAHLPKS